MKVKDVIDEVATLTGRVCRCDQSETCNIKDCYHHSLHEFELACSVKCPEHSSAACIPMYGGEKITGIYQGEQRLLRKCCNCGEIQETQHMRYSTVLLGWLCSRMHAAGALQV